MTMNKQKMVAYGFTVLMAVAFTVALIPSATAQGGTTNQVDVIVKPAAQGGDALAPEVGQLPIKVTTDVKIPPVSGCTALISVKYTVDKPAYSTAVMSPAADSETFESSTAQGVPVSGAASETVSFESTLTITTTREAPAFITDEYTVNADVTVQATGCNLSGKKGSAPVQVKNGYFALIETVPVQTLLKAGQNSQVQFPIDVTNFGNADTRVSSDFKYNSKDQLSALIPPAPFVLESKATAGQGASNAKQSYVTVRTPHNNGYVNDVYAFSITFDGEFAGSVPAGAEPPKDQQTVFLSLQVQGVYAPGFDPVFAIGALGIGMVGMRRFAK